MKPIKTRVVRHYNIIKLKYMSKIQILFESTDKSMSDNFVTERFWKDATDEDLETIVSFYNNYLNKPI
jgi:hypothetical protein